MQRNQHNRSKPTLDLLKIKINSNYVLQFKYLPFDDKIPPVKHPADNEFTMSCFARY